MSATVGSAGDRVVRYTDESVRIECAQSVLPYLRLRQLAGELVQLNRTQREEA